MNLLISLFSNVYQNLATEEFLLKNSLEDFLFLYVNKPCVVVGKHQIAQKEINSKFTFDNNILIARRLSGGGAVYHDEGNLNFSFIQTTRTNENLSYKNIISPIFSFLLQIGINVTMSERNDLTVDGKKISGSAMHLFKNRVLAHGTLLIDSNIENISGSLNGNSQKYADKSIASRRSKVANLSQFNQSIEIDYFRNSVSDYLTKVQGYTLSNPLPQTSLNMITELAGKKYATTEWIYGYSPKYSYHTTLTIDRKVIPISLEVEKGVIEAIIVDSKHELKANIQLKLNELKGLYHNYSSMNSLFVEGSDSEISQKFFTAFF
jgi:lipoate---protein ligase